MELFSDKEGVMKIVSVVLGWVGVWLVSAGWGEGMVTEIIGAVTTLVAAGWWWFMERATQMELKTLKTKLSELTVQ